MLFGTMNSRRPDSAGASGADVQEASMRIVEYPQAWSVYRGDVRKCLLHRFPYSLLYSIEEDHILVIAVAHQHRRPYYWIDSGD